MIFHCVYQKFKPLPNKPIVMKHHKKNLYLEFHKPVGTFHLLDLDRKWACNQIMDNFTAGIEY